MNPNQSLIRLNMRGALPSRRHCSNAAIATRSPCGGPARTTRAAGSAAAAAKRPAACAARSTACRTRSSRARGRTSSRPRRAISARRSARRGNACRGICMSRQRRHTARDCERRRHSSPHMRAPTPRWGEGRDEGAIPPGSDSRRRPLTPPSPRARGEGVSCPHRRCMALPRGASSAKFHSLGAIHMRH